MENELESAQIRMAIVMFLQGQEGNYEPYEFQPEQLNLNTTKPIAQRDKSSLEVSIGHDGMTIPLTWSIIWAWLISSQGILKWR